MIGLITPVRVTSAVDETSSSVARGAHLRGGELWPGWSAAAQISPLLIRRSRMDELDVASRCCCELAEILSVNRHDLVTVGGKQDNSGVNYVGESGGSKKQSGRPTEWLIERADIDSFERLRQPGLAWAASPHLPEDTGMRQREVARDLGGLQSCPHPTFVALQSDEGAAVEDEAHDDFALGIARRRRPRTTVASSRSVR